MTTFNRWKVKFIGGFMDGAVTKIVISKIKNGGIPPKYFNLQVPSHEFSNENADTSKCINECALIYIYDGSGYCLKKD